MMEAGRGLLIIDPSVNVAETEGAEAIAASFSGASRVMLPAMRAEDRLAGVSVHDVSALVVMGSASSVYDGLSWQLELESWLEPVLRGDVVCPLLGVCYGHQLIAKMGGGSVGYLDPVGKAKRLGVEESCFSGSRILPDDTRLQAVVSHREHVVRAPPGYRVVATRPGVSVDALEHVSLPIFGVQFHPEAGPEFASHAGIPLESVSPAVRADGLRVIRAYLGQH